MKRESKRLLIKIGSEYFKRGWCFLRLWRLTGEISKFKKKGWEVIIVSSGAVVFGEYAFNNAKKKAFKNIYVNNGKAVRATIGQPRLMFWFSVLFWFRGVGVSQCLYTRHELEEDKEHYVSSTLSSILTLGLVPIVNANDAVDHEELDALGRYKDNDILAEKIALMMKVDLVVVISTLEDAKKKMDNFTPFINVNDNEQVKELFGEVLSNNCKTKAGTGDARSKICIAVDLAEEDILVCIVDINNGNFLTSISRNKNPGQLYYSGEKYQI